MRDHMTWYNSVAKGACPNFSNSRQLPNMIKMQLKIHMTMRFCTWLDKFSTKLNRGGNYKHNPFLGISQKLCDMECHGMLSNDTHRYNFTINIMCMELH